MVKQILIDALEALGYDVYQENAIIPEDKETYITFHVADTYDIAYFSNKRIATNWVFEVKLFESDPYKLENSKLTIRETLESMGFTTDGLGWDILSSGETSLLGWYCDFNYMEMF